MRFVLFGLVPVVCLAQQLPPSFAPGAIDPGVTQSNIHATVCHAGYAASQRPDERWVLQLKRKQLKVMFHGRPMIGKFIMDHRVPLELGGAPENAKNLYPEPYAESHLKDRLENALHHDVCTGRVTLQSAQSVFLGDFWNEYRRRFLWAVSWEGR